MKKHLLLAILILLPLVASADAVEIDGLYYNLNVENQTAEVTKNPNKYSGGVTIPKSVTYENVTYSVASIGKEAFMSCSRLTSVAIPNSVTSIGNKAFWSCNSLTSLTIPYSVTFIGEWAFDLCHGLNSINVDAGNPIYDSRNNCNAIINTASGQLLLGCKNTVIPNSVISIGAFAFNGCNDLTSLTIPNSVTSIGNQAFWGCNNLTSLTIPNSVTSIGDHAFEYCSSLTSVTIPNSVTSISKKNIFSYCSSLNSIIVESGNPVYDSRDNCNAIIETATGILLAGCKSTVIPKSVTSIGYQGFFGCSGLISVTIPSSVTSICDDAFADCSDLNFVIIPNSVASIGEYAFAFCSSLTSVTIPNSVTSISYEAFRDCNGLESVTIMAQTPPEMKENSFSNFDIPLYVPKGTRDAYLAASPWNKFKEIIEMDEADEDVIKISSAGQSTWCSKYDLDFTGVEGVKAYIASGYNRATGTIWLTRVNEVPANEGVLIIGKEGDYKVPHITSYTYYMNMMVGTLKAITINEKEGEYTNYYLSNGDYGVGFYKVNGTQAISANRAYLPLLKGDVPAGTRFISLGFEDGEGTTGINGVKSGEVKTEKWFNLQGQRVMNPGKGLYIKNGKKIVIK